MAAGKRVMSRDLTPSHELSGWIRKVLEELGRHQAVLAWGKERWRRCGNGTFYSVAGPATVRPHRSSCLSSPDCYCLIP